MLKADLRWWAEQVITALDDMGVGDLGEERDYEAVEEVLERFSAEFGAVFEGPNA
jgi:hypothetical protein